MTISGLKMNPYDYGYVQKTALNADNRVTEKVQSKSQENLSGVQNEEPSVVKAPKILAKKQLEDFVFDFKKNKEFSMNGEDSDLSGLDMPKNIAETRKDELLDQYRYFVGEKNELVQFASPDGMVTRVLR